MLVCSDVVGAEQKFFSSAEGGIVVVRGGTHFLPAATYLVLMKCPVDVDYFIFSLPTSAFWTIAFLHHTSVFGGGGRPFVPTKCFP